MNRSALRGLYAITPERNGPKLPAMVEAALRGGARLIQYRDKSGDHERRLNEARELAARCRAFGALFIINDDVALAAAIEADGVHIGRDDGDIASARARLGDSAIVGVSCYNDIGLARRAAADGADYVAFGSFFASAIKPDAVRADLHLLEQARELPCAVAAIGGITAANAAPLVAAGADMLAVINGVFAAADIETAARELVAVIENQRKEKR